MKTRKMKDSGVEWLGSVPEGWKVLRMKCCLRNISEKGHPDAEVLSLYRDLGVVPKSSRDDNHNVTGEDTTQYKFVRIGDLVINKMKAWQGSLAVSGYTGIVSPAYYVCRFNGLPIERGYAHYLMRNRRHAQEFERLSTGMRVGQWDLGIDDFMRVPLVYPPLPEQRAIAAYLDKRCAKIDAMVADAKKLIEEYKAWKASLIFEAVTGKVGVDGRCRCRKMRDSGVDWIGQVPEGWVFYPIKRFFSFFKGLNITKADLTESGIPVVSYGQIHAKNNTGTHLQDELLRHVPQHYMESCPESRLKENDFVFADTSEDLEGLGNCAFVDRSDAVMAGYHTIVLRPVKNAHFKYLAYLFRADCWRRQMREIAFGIKVYSLSQRMLRQCSLVLPPLPEQRAIAAYLDRKCAAIDRVVAVKEGLIGDLEAYKKSLIFECVTGKREVA